MTEFQISLPNPWVPGAHDPNSFEFRVQENFDKLTTELRTHLGTVSAEIPAATAAVPIPLKHLGGTLANGVATFILTPNEDAGITSTANTGYKGAFYLNAAQSVTGKTAKVRLAGHVYAGAVAMTSAGQTVTQRLHTLSSVSGGVVTLGTQVISDTLTASNLGADTGVNHSSSYVDHPGAGWYVVSVNATANLDGTGAEASVRVELNYQ